MENAVQFKVTIFLLLLMLPISVFGLNSLDLNFSVAYQPFVSFGNVLMGFDNMKLDYNKGQGISFFTDLKHRSGFNFGFGFGIDTGYKKNDNIVGILSDVLAYIGMKNFSVRVTHFTIPGTANLNKGY